MCHCVGCCLRDILTGAERYVGKGNRENENEINDTKRWESFCLLQRYRIG
jgi:hypothetical protein